MKYNKLTGYAGVLVLSAVLSASVMADSKGGHDGDNDGDDGRNTRSVKAELEGYQEVPSVSSPCEGEFRARISNDGRTIGKCN